ncbi:E3 ubiquitin-protein ligase UBR3, partial [Stegodyphus mimosarum]
MVSLLCMSDRTHSQLMDLLPDKCGATSQNKDFESILNKVADYKAPNFEAGGTMLQGMFVPKPQIWEEEYDPIHVLLRAVHRREYQSSLDRYTQHLRQANKYSGSHAPWPPFRIPGPVHSEFVDPRRILHSKTMHGIIFTILHRAVNDPDIPEQILSLCIYLLDMAVRFSYSGTQSNEKKAHKEVEDLNYDEWFDSSETLENITHIISRVIITEKVQMSMRMVEEMEVDEEVEIVDMDLDLYDVQSPIVEEDVQESGSQQPALPATSTQLALPAAVSSTTNTQLVPVTYASGSGELAVVPSTSSSSTSSSTSSSSTSQDFFPTSSQQPAVASGSNSFNMALIPTSEGLATVRPKCLRLKQVPGRHRMLLLDKGLPLVSDNGLPMPVGSESGSSGEPRYLPFSNKRTIDVNESILSLLLQLHSKLSEKPDSYRIKPRESLSQESINLRIGDGVTYIERLIDRVAASEDKVSIIQNIKQRLWPKKTDSTASPSSEYMSENLDKEVKRRRAKERQQKLMAEFASKQKAFMQKTLETDSKESLFEDSLIDEDKEYECVICGQMTASEEERPVGMVVLLQATSVTGHYHQNPVRKLPCGDDERLDLQKGKTLAAIVENKIDLLTRHFDNKHWPMALNIGWEGGVHVQSCGHYLHIDCHKSYIQSLKNQSQLSSRLQNLAVDRGEYSCPLCRQLANSVIPIIPNFGKTAALVNCPGRTLSNLASDLSELLSSPLSEREANLLKKYMGGIMEDITHATYPQYRSVCSPNSSSLFLFVCSISRTNLEVELVQRGGTLNNPLKKKSCFVPLLHVLSMHSRFLCQSLPNKVWTRLTGQMPSDHYSVAVWDAEVPLLFRDCTALLLQIVLTLPLNLEKAYYRCVIQILYNFLYIQAIVQLSCNLTCSQRHTAKRNGMQKSNSRKISENETLEEHSKNIWRKTDEDADFNDLIVILGEVISQLEHSSLYYTSDDEIDPAQRSTEWTEESMEKFVRDYCLHFLKIASLLQSHLYEEEVPQMKPCESEFQHLCQFLGLSGLFNLEFTAATCLQWAVQDPRILIGTWCQDFMNFANKSVIAARVLLQRPIIWYPPALLKLPQNYDEIFKYYHKKSCRVCHSEPKDPSLCLVCGTMVCLRENCCRQQAHYEAVLHSVICGAGTAMYLAVNSSTIIVIRGKRACLWGSVYLDSYGEEDRDLKRGKPLFLSEDRYNLLQQQWINHSFDHTNKRWVWHKDNL